MKLTFWLEFGSTYSYPTAMRIESLAAQYAVAIEWRAFLLGPIFAAQGWDDSPFNIYPAKGRYMWRDLERVCAARDISFRRPTDFPRNGLLAARVACRFADEPWLPDFVCAVYRANFVEDQDIASEAVVSSCLLAAERPADEILDAASRPDAKALLRERTQTAIGLGIFGAPSFTIGEELFWGDDRLEAALEWCASARADAETQLESSTIEGPD